MTEWDFIGGLLDMAGLLLGLIFVVGAFRASRCFDVRCELHDRGAG